MCHKPIHLFCCQEWGIEKYDGEPEHRCFQCYYERKGSTNLHSSNETIGSCPTYHSLQVTTHDVRGTIINAATGDEFQDLPKEVLLKGLKEMTKEDTVHGKKFWSTYSSWDKLTDSQRDKTKEFYLRSLKTTVEKTNYDLL